MKRTVIISLIVTIVGFWSFAYGEEGIDEVLDNLQARYDQTDDFSAVFTQETISKRIGAPVVMNGKAYVKKPGMMKWEYTEPKKSQYISDGRTLWYYLPDDKQVRIYGIAEVFDTLPFYSFLTGKGKVRDGFTASFENLDKGQADEYYLIALVPKAKDSVVDRILILVSRNDYLIHQINTYQKLGDVTRIAFKDIAVNSGLKDSMFHFIVPTGVEIFQIGEKTQPLPKPNVKIEIEENK